MTETARLWGNKRYHSLNHHLRQVFGGKVFKVALDAGFTCPNRDGAVGTGGCAFCSSRGSGEFAGRRETSLHQQFQEVREIISRKWPRAEYIAYFQAFSNTYGPVSRLREIYRAALAEEGVVGLSIATRPDCLPQPVLDLLAEFNRMTYLWVELGLQTVHPSTARAMNLGYGWLEFETALRSLRSRDIRVCPHIILGLPGETRAMMMETARRVADSGVQGIKIHLFFALAGSSLEEDFRRGELSFMSREEYIELVVDILEILPPSVVVHRLTGDSPRDLLLGPMWSLKKWEILNDIDRELERRNTWQNKFYRGAGHPT